MLGRKKQMLLFVTTVVLLAVAVHAETQDESPLPTDKKCTTFIRQTCDQSLLRNETRRFSKKSECPDLLNSTLMGLNNSFDAYWKYPEGPLTYCAVNGQPKYFTIPEFLQKKMTTILTLAQFDHNADYKYESAITVLALDGTERRIGTFIPYINTQLVVQNLQIPDLTEEEEQYPFNGKALCDNRVTYQRWDIPPSLASIGIQTVKIYDPRTSLRIYAMSVDNCSSYVQQGDTLATVTQNMSSRLDPQLFLKDESRGYVSWADCAVYAKRKGSTAFFFNPVTSDCVFLNETYWVVSANPGETKEGRMMGTLPTVKKAFGSFSGIPGAAPNPLDQTSVLRPALYGELTPHLFLTPRSSTLRRVEPWVTGLTEYSVAGSQFTGGETPSFITVVAGKRVYTCGNPMAPQIEFPTPFIERDDTGVTMGFCEKFSHCTIQTFPKPYTGRVTVDYNVLPKTAGCPEEQGIMTVLYLKATSIGGASYWFTRQTRSKYSTPDDAIITFAAFHQVDTSKIQNLNAYVLPSGTYSYRYTLTPDTTTSPRWYFTDAESRTRVSDLWCEAYDVPHYQAQYRMKPSDSGYNCSMYTTMFEAAAACGEDPKCLGYTTKQTGGTEQPDCLYEDLGTPAAEPTYTLYVKKGMVAECKFQAAQARYAKVSVTNTADASVKYEILADDQVLGSCTGLDTSVTGPASCIVTYECWKGEIASNTKSLIVRATFPTMMPQRRCSRTLLGALVEFDVTKLDFQPQGTCLTQSEAATSCTASAVSAPCTNRERAGISYGSSACTAGMTKPIGRTIIAPPTSSRYVSLVTVVEFTSQASVQGSALTVVLAETKDGSNIPIGYIMRDPSSGNMKSFSVLQTPVPSYSLCQGTGNAKNSLAYAQAFALPTSLVAKGLKRIFLRGPDVRFVSALFAEPDCAAPVGIKPSDVYYTFVSNGLKPSGPLLESPSTADYALCAEKCSENGRCGVFSWKDGSCSLYHSFGRSISYENNRATGSRSRTRVPYYFAPAITGHLGTMLSSLAATASSITAFGTTEITLPLRLLVRSMDGYQLLLGQTGFGGANSVAMTAVASFGGSLVCGNNHDPFASSPGTTGKCGSVLSCTRVQFNSAITSHLQLQPSALESSSCGLPFWGFVGTNGTVSNGLEYYAVSVHDVGETIPIPSADSGTPFVATVPKMNISGINRQVVFMDSAYNDRPDIVSRHNRRVMCSVGIKTIYNVEMGKKPKSTYSCGAKDADAAMKACTDKADCAGYTIDLSTGKADCYTTNATDIESSNSVAFLRKITRSTCIFELSTPGVVSVSVAQIGLYYSAKQDVKIYMNGKLLRSCGYSEPWASGAFETSTTSNDCNNYIECVNQLIVGVGTLEVVFPPTTTTCNQNFGSVIAYLETPALEPSERTHAAAATLPYRRRISTAALSKVDLRVGNALSAAVLVNQDRWDCPVGCHTPYALNFTVASHARTCAGLTGFAEGPGLSRSCNNFYYCGAMSQNKPAAYITASSGAVTLALTDASLATENYCNKPFTAELFTNGLLFAADASLLDTRTVFVIISTTTASISELVSMIPSQLSTAHKEMNPAVTSETPFINYPVSFPLFINYEARSRQSYAFYDFPNVFEENKAIHIGTFACVGDRIIVDGRKVQCRMRVTSNFITVRASQGKFDTRSDTITIITETNRVTCGGDANFFGYSGMLDACDRYFTCYADYIPANSTVTIEFSDSAVETSRCHPSVVALVTTEERPELPPLNCDSSKELTCVPNHKCIPVDDICNRFNDCDDLSDEGRCSTWRFAGEGMEPVCSPQKTLPKVVTPTDCKRHAILEGFKYSVYTINPKEGCKLYSCVSFQKPEISDTADKETSMYVYTRDPFNFGYCTSALHCSGNGKINGRVVPCSCTCDPDFVGQDCGLLRSLGDVTQLIVMYRPNVSLSMASATVLSNVVTAQLRPLSTVVLDTVETSEAGLAAYLTIRNPDGVKASSELLNALLTNETAESILNRTSDFGALYLTAIGPSTTQVSYNCRKSSLTEERLCTTTLDHPVNSTRTISISIPGVQLTGSTTGRHFDVLDDASNESESFATVTLKNAKGVAVEKKCERQSATLTRDHSKEGPCSYVTRCTFAVEDGAIINASTMEVRYGSKLNSKGVTCDNNAINVLVDVYGRDFLPDEVDDEAPTTETEYNSIFLYVFFAVLGLGIICFILFVTWCRIRKSYPKLLFAGPLTLGLAFFLILFSLAVLAYYFDTAETTYTHSLMVEEYRDEKCTSSRYAPLPLRAGHIPIDGNCYEVNSLGVAEGTLFMSAEASKNKTGPVLVRSGPSKVACESEVKIELTATVCTHEKRVAPWKSELHRQYMAVRIMKRDKAAERMRAIRHLNPTEPTGAVTPISILPASDRWDALLPNGSVVMSSSRGGLTIHEPNLDTRYLLVPSPNDTYLDTTPFTTDEVRFAADVFVDRTLFTAAETRVYDNPPRQTEREELFGSNGTIFNDVSISFSVDSLTNFATATESGGKTKRTVASSSNYRNLTGVDANNVMVLYGVKGSSFDLSTHDDYTIHLWIRAGPTSRGVVFATMDGWLTRGMRAPLVERLIKRLENGEYGPTWFTNSSWAVYSALFVNARSGEVSLTAATSDDIKKVTWNLFDLGVERLFNDRWHLLAITVERTSSDNQNMQLFVDGESHRDIPGWLKCVDWDFEPVQERKTGDFVSVYSATDDVVTPDGILVLGHFNGGIYAFGVTGEVMSQEAILNIGAEGMESYDAVALGESMTVGIVSAIIAVLLILYSIYYAIKKEFGTSEEAFEELAEYDERGRRIQKETEHVDEVEASVFTSSVRFSSFISPLLLLFQTITLFLQGWKWPEDYYNLFRYFAIVSIDLNDFLPGVPVITWALLQFAIAVGVFILLIVVYLLDIRRFENVVNFYKEAMRVKALQRKVRNRQDEEMDALDIPRPLYTWVVHDKNGTRPLTSEQEEILLRSLQEVMTSRNRHESNMRVYTKHLVDMGDLGRGIVLYERIKGKVYISFRTSLHSLEHDQEAPVVDVTQTYFELTCDNTTCPEHKKRLFPDDLHALVCVHSDNPYYRSKECPRRCLMYKCPEEGCEYAVCEFCYGGTAITGAVSDALQTIRSVRKFGIGSTLGSFLVILSQLIYIPAVKNALMIVSCHEYYRCEFGGCWKNPSLRFLIMVLISAAVLTCVGVGYIGLTAFVLYRRRQVMLEVLPLQRRKTKGKCQDCLKSKMTCQRGAYNEFLKMDTSMLQAMYTAYEFDYYYAGPFLIVYRLALILSVVLPPPDTLAQLAPTQAVSLLFAIIIVYVNMYKNIWIEVLVRLGAFHNIVILALVALHRVYIRNDLTSDGYAQQMIAVTFLYIGIVCILWVISVVVPFIRGKCQAYKRRKDMADDKEEEIYDIGFWGETRHK